MGGLYLLLSLVAFAVLFVAATRGVFGGRLERMTIRMANWWAL